MMRHAPAGRRIAADVWTRADAPRWSPVRTRYFDSATAALAVAIEEELGGSSDERVVRLPAYACPNLVAATVHAGARPLFVDFLPGGALPTLTEMIGPGAGVAVAVDFCGVPTPAGSGPRSAGRLVHDLAQSFAPFMPGWQPLTSRSVVSFGRAKPVSLTRGGALLGGEAPARARDAVEPGGFALRARAYNLSLNPLAFGVLARLPFLGIGATVYHELDEVRAFGEAFAARADAAVRSFRATRDAISEGTRRALDFARGAAFSLPFDVAGLPPGLPLWRLPVTLADAAAARHFAERGARFGVSRLYQKTLPEILGTSSEEARQRWPHAWQLSRTLVTLPTHGRLDDDDWGRLLSCMDRTARR